MNKIKYVVSYVVFYPLVWLMTAWFWWDIHANGVEPKTGSILFKSKRIGDSTYTKRKGLFHSLTRWKKVEYKEPNKEPNFSCNDISSYYPHMIMSRGEL